MRRYVGIRYVGFRYVGLLILALSLLGVGGCTKAHLVPDTTFPLAEGEAAGTPESQAQERVDVAMAALGDAYRLATSSDEVTEPALAAIADGFAGTAYDAEEANLRDALDTRKALAAVPANPLLYIDEILEGTDTCQVAKAVLDDRPLQAFPVAGEGIPVIVRLTATEPEQPTWRIDVLASTEQLAGRKVSCSDISIAQTTVVTTTTTTSPAPAPAPATPAPA